ncbi:unnamed protein product [Closterium sp. Yama58-4]|nr:unnamed protein product [Closterium sp. Yama58-4]
MPHSSPETAASSPPSQSSSLAMKPWSPGNLLKKHLRRTLVIAMDGHSHFQENQQQQQRQDGTVSPESQSPALSFGGLSYEECRSVFLSPNARSSSDPYLPSLWIPPTAPHTALLTAAAAAASSPFSLPSFSAATSPPKVAALPNVIAVPNAAALPNDAVPTNTPTYARAASLSLPMKRARQELSALTTDQPLLSNASRDELRLPRRVAQRPQSLRELLHLHGERRWQQRALWPAVGSQRAWFARLLPEERRQQEGESSAVQRVKWPRVGSESVLPDDVLLGCSSDEPVFMQRAALSAPAPTQLHEALPAPMPTQLAALPGSLPCSGDFTPCCEELASCFGDAPSADARTAAQQLAQSVDSCSHVNVQGNGDLHDSKIDMHVHDSSNHDSPVHNDSDVHYGRSESLFLDAPVSELCLAEPASTAPLVAERPAPPRGEVALPECAVEQGNTRNKQHLSAPVLPGMASSNPQHSHDTLSHPRAPQMPDPMPPPALPHVQPHMIASPTLMKPAVGPCFNLGDTMGGGSASWEASFPPAPGLDSNVPSASSLLGFGETADLKVEEGWKMDMPGGGTEHDETYSFPDTAMLSSGIYPTQLIHSVSNIPPVLSSPHTLPKFTGAILAKLLRATEFHEVLDAVRPTIAIFDRSALFHMSAVFDRSAVVATSAVVFNRPAGQGDAGGGEILGYLCSEAELSLLTRCYAFPPHKLALASFFYDAPDALPGGAVGGGAVGGGAVGGGAVGGGAVGGGAVGGGAVGGGAVRRVDTVRAISSLHDPSSGFIIRGHAPSLEMLASYRVLLAPLRYGAGIKGKILDSWRHGTPVVITPMGAEGMGSRGGGCGKEQPGEEDKEAFAADAVRLYGDPLLWATCQSAGGTILQQHFGMRTNAPSLLAALSAAKANMRDNRMHDYTGAMLWHDSNRATEYFSRWIELKEKGARPPQ